MENKLSGDALTLELLKAIKELTQEERQKLLSLWKEKEAAH